MTDPRRSTRARRRRPPVHEDRYPTNTLEMVLQMVSLNVHWSFSRSTRPAATCPRPSAPPTATSVTPWSPLSPFPIHSGCLTGGSSPPSLHPSVLVLRRTPCRTPPPPPCDAPNWQNCEYVHDIYAPVAQFVQPCPLCHAVACRVRRGLKRHESTVRHDAW